MATIKIYRVFLYTFLITKSLRLNWIKITSLQVLTISGSTWPRQECQTPWGSDKTFNWRHWHLKPAVSVVVVYWRWKGKDSVIILGSLFATYRVWKKRKLRKTHFNAGFQGMSLSGESCNSSLASVPSLRGFFFMILRASATWVPHSLRIR